MKLDFERKMKLKYLKKIGF